jgi:hypothetical protein
MPKRKDAFYAASQALVYLHEEIDKLEIDGLVYTTGEVVCHPCVHTCVPDCFDFSIDVRLTMHGIAILYIGMRGWSPLLKKQPESLA